jgi:hypothetical protein
MTGHDLGDDLRHAPSRALLKALDQAHHRNPRPDVLRHLGQHRAQRLEGTAITSTSADPAASARSAVARSDGVSRASPR